MLTTPPLDILSHSHQLLADISYIALSLSKARNVSRPTLGGYHIFMILVGFAFHKTNYKRFSFHFFFPSNIFSDQGYEYIYILFLFLKTIFHYVGFQNFENSWFSQTKYYLLFCYFF
jgi:hypothetical protein